MLYPNPTAVHGHCATDGPSPVQNTGNNPKVFPATQSIEPQYDTVYSSSPSPPLRPTAQWLARLERTIKPPEIDANLSVVKFSLVPRRPNKPRGQRGPYYCSRQGCGAGPFAQLAWAHRHEDYSCGERSAAEKEVVAPCLTCPLPECPKAYTRPSVLRDHVVSKHGLTLAACGKWEVPCLREGCTRRMEEVEGTRFPGQVSVQVCTLCFPVCKKSVQ
jgi:hypothetical protein